MKKISNKIVFFGNERLATGVITSAPTLKALVTAGYDVVAVVSHYTRGSSRNARVLEIETVAKEHGIPLLLPHKPIEIAEQLKAYNADAAVLVAYGKIVPQEIIDIFPAGIINIHPSLLPLHRGSTPIESVMLSGESETGVSLMQLASVMDAGPVFTQEAITLSGKETKQELADKLLEIGKDLVITYLSTILAGKLEPAPQDDSQATYDSLIEKQDGIIDWQKPAKQIEREIRAYAEWPKSRTTLANKDVVITQAHSVPSTGDDEEPGSITIAPESKAITIATTNGSLRIEKLKPDGKNEMTTNAFLAGYGNNL